MQFFIDLVIVGLSIGMIYAQVALGISLIFSGFDVVHFAHGEIYMIGAFTGLIAATILAWTGLPPLALLPLAALAAMVWAAAWGLAVERVAYRPLRGAARLAPLISAIGVSIHGRIDGHGSSIVHLPATHRSSGRSLLSADDPSTRDWRANETTWVQRPATEVRANVGARHFNGEQVNPLPVGAALAPTRPPCRATVTSDFNASRGLKPPL